MNVAFALPGWFEMLLLAAFLIVPAAVIFVVLRAGQRNAAAPPQPAFPVIDPAERDGPGTYHVRGVDKNTRSDRELSIDADSRANAQVKAELDGMIVTAVRKFS